MYIQLSWRLDSLLTLIKCCCLCCPHLRTAGVASLCGLVQAIVQVDEFGTEAAAATAAVTLKSAFDPKPPKSLVRQQAIKPETAQGRTQTRRSHGMQLLPTPAVMLSGRTLQAYHFNLQGQAGRHTISSSKVKESALLNALCFAQSYGRVQLDTPPAACGLA